MILYLSMFIGVALFGLDKLNRALPRPDFTWSLFFKINGVSIVMNLLAGIALAVNQAEVIALFQKVVPTWAFTAGGLFGFMCGLLGSWIVQFLVSLVHKSEKTAVGMNSKD